MRIIRLLTEIRDELRGLRADLDRAYVTGLSGPYKFIWPEGAREAFERIMEEQRTPAQQQEQNSRGEG